MILDALLALSKAQAVTNSAVSTNTIDLGVARDIGSGRELYAVITVDEAATAAGAATVTFQAIVSANADLSAGDVVSQTGAIGKADLTLGRKPIVVPISPNNLPGTPNGRRYLGLNYSVGTGPLTAGKFTCYITDHAPDVGKNYASGFTVA